MKSNNNNNNPSIQPQEHISILEEKKKKSIMISNHLENIKQQDISNEVCISKQNNVDMCNGQNVLLLVFIFS